MVTPLAHQTQKPRQIPKSFALDLSKIPMEVMKEKKGTKGTKELSAFW